MDYSQIFLSDNFFEDNPFSWKKDKKHSIFVKCFDKLSSHHYKNCEKYKNIMDAFDAFKKPINKLDQFPYLPVNVFKDDNYITGSKKNIFKTLHSSGTSGNNFTKIFLSKENAALQAKVLAKIVSSFIGSQRLPMLAIDSIDNYKKNTIFSARSAAIRGFSIFAKNISFALKSDSSLDIQEIKNFFKKNKNKKIIIFGFTFSVYKDFLLALSKKKIKINFSSGVLIHGGGWKKMLEKKISNSTFRKMIKDILNISVVHNYYGLVEQTGSIYMECEEGHLHSSNFSEIFIRNRILGKSVYREKGIVQLLSPLALSYPGHNIITEDVGEILGEDDCPCGRYGKYFKIHGRLEKAEIRGCSDVNVG